MTLEKWLKHSEAYFRRWDEAREILLRECRELVRESGSHILALHRDAASIGPSNGLDAKARGILSMIRKHPTFAHAGFVQQALGEYVEARLLGSFLTESAAPVSLSKVPGDALLLGVADAIGELRRSLLDALTVDDHVTALTRFDQMETLFAILQDTQAPEPLVGLRPKRDAARGILERTRGDVVNAKKAKELEKKIDGLRGLLDEAEGKPKRVPKKPDPDELDLDSAWGKP